MSPRTWEIIRIIILLVIGAAIMFFAQPYIFLALGSQGAADANNWNYFNYAITVFGVSSFSVAVWYVIALNTRVTSPNSSELSPVRLSWWILFIINIVLCVVMGIFLFNEEPTSSKSVLQGAAIGLFMLDIFITYWLPTAVSGPKESKYVAPLSQLLRPWFND